MDRRDIILTGLDLTGLGLEIGGSYGPIAAGVPGMTVKSLDYLDQAGLVAKYANSHVDTSKIQPVDYVWSGQRYLDLVGDTRFDWILASHVIEHVPDMVAFINECAEILAPTGRLSLVVPDKRREFDCYRPVSGLGGVVDAHLSGRRISSRGLAAEFALNIARLDGRDTWMDHDLGTPQLLYGADVAKAMMARLDKGDYVDIHAWVFTPHSFRLLIEDLFALGLIGVREASFTPSDQCEFYIQLSSDAAGPGIDRLELCRLALAELRDPIAAGPPPSPMPDPMVETLQAEVAGLRREVAALQASTSWKLTAPLRALRRLAGG